MKSSFNLLSAEIIYEIFDYLTGLDIFNGFSGLNYYLNRFISSYPMKLDFRQISRSNLDLICAQLQPQQVYSLRLSEEYMPDQIPLLLYHFPDFQNKFINLKSIDFTYMRNMQISLPCQTSSLAFQQNFPKEDSDEIIMQIISQQAKVLTYLNVDSTNAVPYDQVYFPCLTHLIINDDCSSEQLYQIFQCLDISSLIYLKVSLFKDDNYDNEVYLQRFGSLCENLSSLSQLEIKLEFITSFDVLENCLMKMIRLKSLTIEGSGKLDIINAIRWEEYLRKASIEKFKFRFTVRDLLKNSSEDLLEQFRSNFWFEEKHWYVAYSEDSFNDVHNIYSVPHFRPQSASNVLDTYPPLSTVPLDLYNKIFFDHQLDSYFYNITKSKSFNFCLTKTKSLAIYNGMCDSIHCRELIDTLTSCIDLKQVQKLDFSTFISQQIDIIQLILTHTCHVQQLILTPFDSAFIFPEHIHSLYLRKTRKRPYERDIDESAYPIYHENIDELSQSLINIRHLQVVIQSKELMSLIIDKFRQLKSVTFEFDNHVSSKDISTEWFQKNTQRLKKNNVVNPYRVENSSSSVQRYSNSLNVIPINNFTWHIRTNSELYREKRDVHVNFDYLIHYVCLSMSNFHKNE